MSVSTMHRRIILIFPFLIPVLYAYPFGAGPSACKTLVPGHKITPQPVDTLPFVIEPESEYFTPGRALKVRVKTSSGKYKNRKIGGFFIQARAADFESDEPLGRWEVEHGEGEKYGIKASNCSRPFDSITHAHSTPKTADLVLHFIPTEDMPDQIVFMGTIARDYRTFWTNVKSGIITKRVVPHTDPVPTTSPMPPSRATEQPTTESPTTTTAAPKRIHHVTHATVHEGHSEKPHHVQHHHASSKRPVHHRKTTTTTTTTPKFVEKFVTVDEKEKYLEEKEKGYHGKNDLDVVKTKIGSRDDEDRFQNDGNVNPDPHSAKSKQSRNGSTRHIVSISTLISTLSLLAIVLV